MTQNANIDERLKALPPKVSLPFAQLLAANQLDNEALAVILDASELAGETFRLLGFAIAYLHMRSKGVPVGDVVRMAKSQGRSVSLGWSAKRWKDEHERLARSETLIRLAEENVSYDVSCYESHLPKGFAGYLIRTSRRLGMEGLRQRHCIASYHSQLVAGRCAVATVFMEGQRWTVELNSTGISEAPIRIAQIRSRFNELPSRAVRDAIHDILNIPVANRDSVEQEERENHYMQILRMILPALREHGVQTVSVDFDGSGDCGSIDLIQCYPSDSDDVLERAMTHPTQNRVFQNGTWTSVTEQIRQPIRDAIEELTYDYLETTGIDWYNNEGGFGELVIDVTRGTVSIDVSTRVIESVTQYSDVTDIVTGETV
ncbi:MAG: hypothetical protein KDN22_24065 [Verrucomicrobiae bacterium]|nr:hypothetical protein [Verrucomicrobiae bacterium]